MTSSLKNYVSNAFQHSSQYIKKHPALFFTSSGISTGVAVGAYVVHNNKAAVEQLFRHSFEHIAWDHVATTSRVWIENHIVECIPASSLAVGIASTAAITLLYRSLRSKQEVKNEPPKVIWSQRKYPKNTTLGLGIMAEDSIQYASINHLLNNLAEEVHALKTLRQEAVQQQRKIAETLIQPEGLQIDASTQPAVSTEPEASEPEASEPEASEPEASEPEASEPEASKVEASTTQPAVSTEPPALSQPILSQPEAKSEDEILEKTDSVEKNTKKSFTLMQQNPSLYRDDESSSGEE